MLHGIGRESPNIGVVPRAGSAAQPPLIAMNERMRSGSVPSSGALHAAGPGAGILSRVGTANENTEANAPELQSKVETILREWIQLCYKPVAQKEPQQALATIIHSVSRLKNSFKNFVFLLCCLILSDYVSNENNDS